MGKIKERWFFICLILIIGLTTVLMTVMFGYQDLVSQTAWSVNIWDLLVKGDLGNFFTYTEQNLRGSAAENCAGNWLTLIPMAIWNLPLWITHYFGGITPVVSQVCLVWSKLLFVFANFISAWYAYKIVAKITADKQLALYAIPLIIGSAEILLSVGYAGQDETVYLAAVMIMIWLWMNKNKVGFLVWSIIAITLCPLMLVPFLILVMLREKNIIRILICTGLTLLPSVLFEIIYAGDPGYQYVTQEMPGFISTSQFVTTMLQSSTIGTAFGPVSIPGILFVFIFFICYCLKLNNDMEIKYGIYLVALGMTVTATLMSGYSYRYCIYVPFLTVLVLVMHPENRKMNLFLMMILTYVRTLFCTNTAPFFDSEWLFTKYQKGFILPQGDETAHFMQILSQNHSEMGMILFISMAVLVAVIILLFIINYPKFNFKLEIEVDEKVSLLIYSLCMPAFLVLFWCVFH